MSERWRDFRRVNFCIASAWSWLVTNNLSVPQISRISKSINIFKKAGVFVGVTQPPTDKGGSQTTGERLQIQPKCQGYFLTVSSGFTRLEFLQRSEPPLRRASKLSRLTALPKGLVRLRRPWEERPNISNAFGGGSSISRIWRDHWVWRQGTDFCWPKEKRLGRL